MGKAANRCIYDWHIYIGCLIAIKVLCWLVVLILQRQEARKDTAHV